MSEIVTDAIKAAAFDALVAAIGEKGRFVKMHRIVPRFEFVGDSPEVRDVPIYEWRLQVMGENDFRKALLSMAAQKTGKS